MPKYNWRQHRKKIQWKNPCQEIILNRSSGEGMGFAPSEISNENTSGLLSIIQREFEDVLRLHTSSTVEVLLMEARFVARNLLYVYPQIEVCEVTQTSDEYYCHAFEVDVRVRQGWVAHSGRIEITLN